MGKEEQVEEREVLESIFPDEITDISETEFKVTVILDVPDVAEQEDQPRFSLNVKYPDEYPDVAPHLEMHAVPDSPPHPNFNVAEDRERLLGALGETIQENIGMAMIFTIISTLKEAAEQLIQDRKDAAEAAHEQEVLAAEREENKKFHGTPVTPETFLKWRDGFIREMEQKRLQEEEERLAELKKAKVKETVKLTGRQLWERGLAGNGDDDDDDDDDGGMPEIQKLKVEAA
ncbi:RWD protein [Geosmithia morbida]|uniref:RWD protein n=1 Tax=Geosmithia morbida TaxID=1094350 RepID=A0A9P4YTF1_9HYPO|nr:RWD protein [Geosmithia morbida]KAF4122475.1 RWD protein [Geosmithia morbida]